MYLNIREPNFQICWLISVSLIIYFLSKSYYRIELCLWIKFVKIIIVNAGYRSYTNLEGK